MSDSDAGGSERCPECGREFVKHDDRRDHETPSSDHVYWHGVDLIGPMVTYKGACYSDEPPEATDDV